MQILLNILITFSIYLLLSYSFSIIYQTTKFFHITHGIIITLGAYCVYSLNQLFGINIAISIFVSILFSAALGLLFEIFPFRYLRKNNVSNLVLLIASLGIYIIFQNLISLIFHDSSKSFTTGEVNVGCAFFGALITKTQIATIFTSISLVLIVSSIIKKTKIGKNIRAVSSNSDLSNIFGINSNSVILWVFGLGSVLASITGILVAFDIDMTPTMGFNLLLYGIVAMIIGGVGSTWGLVGGSLLLATAQHLGAYYIDSKWMEPIAYIILILFLIWKPLGFSGKQLKKIEI